MKEATSRRWVSLPNCRIRSATEVHVAGLLDQDQLHKLFTKRPFDGACHLAGLVRVRESFHIAHAYLLALTAAQPGEHLVCNVGTGKGVTVREALEMVEAVTGRRLPVVLRPAANEPPALLADAQRIHQKLGWQPQHSSLDEIVTDAWRAHERQQGLGQAP